MADRSKIEWTDSTWNPVVGCSLVSPGCTNCYAMKQAARIEVMHQGRHMRAGECAPFSPSPYAGLTQDSKAAPVWTGKVEMVDEHALTKPLRWRRPRAIFVCSMGDLWHESVPDAWIDRVFAVMALSPWNVFIDLTKRPKRRREYIINARHNRDDLIADLALQLSGWPKDAHPDRTKTRRHEIMVSLRIASNVVLGVSAERQQEADERIPELLATPAAKRIVSIEPMLGPVDLDDITDRTTLAPKIGEHHFAALPDPDDEPGASYIDGVILGGESGFGARPMHPDWARSVRDQCAAAGVRFFFKQWGAFKPQQPVYWHEDRVAGDARAKEVFGPEHSLDTVDLDSCETFDFMRDFPDVGVLYRDGYFYDGLEYQPPIGSGCWWIERLGRARAGRLLDGREHNDLPWSVAK